MDTSGQRLDACRYVDVVHSLTKKKSAISFICFFGLLLNTDLTSSQPCPKLLLLATAALSASVVFAISMGRLRAKFINCAWLGRPPPRTGMEIELSGSRASVSWKHIGVNKNASDVQFSSTHLQLHPQLRHLGHFVGHFVGSAAGWDCAEAAAGRSGYACS